MSTRTKPLTGKGIFANLLLSRLRHQYGPTPMALTKNDVMECLQAELTFTKSQSVQAAECLLETIKASLESRDDILVSGLEKFCVKVEKGRRVRNPATGEDLMLEKRRVVTFKWSEKLRKRVNGGV